MQNTYRSEKQGFAGIFEQRRTYTTYDVIFDAEEVSGSNPLSPTLINLLFAGKSKSKGEGPGEYAGPSCSNRAATPGPTSS
jgi:hypothetical protein